MLLAVNTRLLIKNRIDGTGRFINETLKRITRDHPEHEFVFFFDRSFNKDFIFSDNITARVIYPQARHPVLWYWWFEISLTRALKKLKPDIFISPDGFLPLSVEAPCIPVIHDLNFHHRPGDLPRMVRNYYNTCFPKFAEKATRIITVSEYSRKDIAKSYDIDPEIIDVVYNGADKLFKPATEIEKKETRKRFTGGKDYFVYAGTLHPRKNIPALLKAFEDFKKETGSDMKLVLAGKDLFRTPGMKKKLKHMNYRNDVILTGRVSAKDMHSIISSATAMTFVSHYEGFGIPVLESMQCGVPVIASNVTSIPEVAGDAALYINPSKPETITAAMKKIIIDIKLRENLIKKGFVQSRKFSWDKTAKTFWESIEKVLNCDAVKNNKPQSRRDAETQRR
ncbi:MAG: glycosyltransferase family 4 protein [Bacteroidetes bacterium]|nr:glycosyltransferase family 4 protein [Bacteroidota bacterium]